DAAQAAERRVQESVEIHGVAKSGAAGVRVARGAGTRDAVPAAVARRRAREAGRAEVVAVGEEGAQPRDLAQERRPLRLRGVDVGDDGALPTAVAAPRAREDVQMAAAGPFDVGLRPYSGADAERARLLESRADRAAHELALVGQGVEERRGLGV